MPKATGKSKAVIQHEVQLITLFDVEVQVEELDAEAEYKLSYDIFVTSLQELGEGLFGFTCHATVGKKRPDQEQLKVQISAAYACSVYSPNATVKTLEPIAKGYAGTMIWSQFTSLFGILSHQMRIEFPPLPVTPMEVDIRQLDELEASE